MRSELIEAVKASPDVETLTLIAAADQTDATRLFEVFGQEKHALKVDGDYVDEDQMVM